MVIHLAFDHCTVSGCKELAGQYADNSGGKNTLIDWTETHLRTQKGGMMQMVLKYCPIAFVAESQHGAPAVVPAGV